ncbi:MAG: 50S ribosomal protein L13 [bacterium]
MKTFSAKAEEIERKWFLIDAEDKVLGRLASQVSRILRGKHKPIFTRHVDTGDHIVIINAEKVRLTGKKVSQKIYYRHSQYPGGLKEIGVERMLKEHPERVIEFAVRGMMPHNRLGRQMLKKLRVYAGHEHPHEAQKPEPLEIEA